jgi:hypothetical protein
VFHRGGKDGPIIAIADACIPTPGATDLKFLEPEQIILLTHKHHPSGVQTVFKVGDKEYAWTGHEELLQDGTKIAKFHPTWFEGVGHHIGHLDFVGPVDGVKDLVVLSSLVVQERSDEHILAV